MTVWGAFGLGISLGLGAGITPGPLLGLVITETLHHGWRGGVSVALAPLLGDVFVIVSCLFLLSQVSSVFFALLSFFGGLYVIFLAWETWRTDALVVLPTTTHTGTLWQSLRKGLTVNLLNPHPYLFWLTVGGPLVMQGYAQSALGAIIAFLGGFYGCLVGSKVGLAVLVHGSRAWLQGRGYRMALQLSGLLLFLLGCLLIREAVRMVGIKPPAAFAFWSVPCRFVF